MSKIYFISDFHLGAPNKEASHTRELAIVRWLDTVAHDATEIYLMGDVFDFWFEYKTVVPRGYTRLLGKLAGMSDAGIKLHYFTGNHDMWTFDYLQDELNCTIYRKPVIKTIDGKIFFLAHGDALGPGDNGYKFMKKFFDSKICQWLFARLHPNLAIGLANYSSRSSRAMTGSKDEIYLGDDKEAQLIYCRQVLATQHIDFFICGHRHLKIDKMLGEKSRYLNLGEWIKGRNYAQWDGVNLELKEFK